MIQVAKLCRAHSGYMAGRTPLEGGTGKVACASMAVSTADAISILVQTGIILRYRQSACIAITKCCPALGILGQSIHVSYDAANSDDEEEDVQGSQKDGFG